MSRGWHLVCVHLRAGSLTPNGSSRMFHSDCGVATAHCIIATAGCVIVRDLESLDSDKSPGLVDCLTVFHMLINGRVARRKHVWSHGHVMSCDRVGLLGSRAGSHGGSRVSTRA